MPRGGAGGMTDLVHVSNMRVAQAKVHEGDPRWYVITANSAIVSGPFDRRSHADEKLNTIRERAKDEAGPED